MKFAGAAAVLAGKALPAEFSRLEHVITTFKSQNQDSGRAHRSLLGGGSTNGSNERMTGRDLKKGWADTRRESALRNLLASQPGPLEKCDPHADVGVLSCGPGRYCLESQLALGQWMGGRMLEAVAPMGGFCVEDTVVSRRLQDANSTTLNEVESMYEICYGDSSAYYSHCSCDGVDVEEYVGTLTCKTEPLCFDFQTYFCQTNVTICSSTSNTFIATAPETSTLTLCSYYTEPSVLSGCTEYINTPSDLPVSCTMQVNGTDCNSCYLALYDVLDDPTYCPIFDCSNTAFPENNELCTGTLPQSMIAFAFLNETLPCPGGCNLCGEGFMNNPGNVTIGDDEFSCYQVEFLAFLGSFTSAECETLADIFEEPCECPVPSP